MRLVDEGYFTLDTTIAELLPSEILDILTEDSPSAQKKIIASITVRQLMSHTAGLSVSGFVGYANGPYPTVQDTLRGAYPANNLRVRLDALPGSGFSYSGGGITVLQIILETVTKTDFPTLMQDKVLKPLGMTRSFFGELPPGEANAAESHETGYTPSWTTHHFQPEYAAAGLWTTPTDLLKAVAAVQRSLDKDDFLKKETAKTMLTKLDKDSGIALSWFIAGENDTNFAHGGANVPGFRCMVVGFAEPGPKKSGIAVMTNSSEGTDVLWRVCLAAGYLKKWPLVASIPSLKMVTPLWDLDATVGEGWRDYLGTWTDGKGEYRVGEEDGRPVLWWNGFGPVKLLPGAVPDAVNEGGVCCFVLDGLKLMLRLKGDGDEKVLVLENGLKKDTTDLKRSS